MELPFIYIIFCKYLRQLQSLFKKFKHNILIILGVFLFVLFCFLITNVKATTVNLSDYQNCNLIGGKYVIIYSYDHDKIYLLTLERADFPYIYTNKHIDSTDDKYISTGVWVSSWSSTWDSQAQGHVKYYTFNLKTNKFENRQNGGIGSNGFNPRKS